MTLRSWQPSPLAGPTQVNSCCTKQKQTRNEKTRQSKQERKMKAGRRKDSNCRVEPVDLNYLSGSCVQSWPVHRCEDEARWCSGSHRCHTDRERERSGRKTGGEEGESGDKHLLHYREGNNCRQSDRTRCRDALIVALTWRRRPSRPRTHRTTSAQVGCPARQAPPWSALQSSSPHSLCTVSPGSSVNTATPSTVMPSGTQLKSVHIRIEAGTKMANGRQHIWATCLVKTFVQAT